MEYFHNGFKGENNGYERNRSIDLGEGSVGEADRSGRFYSLYICIRTYRKTCKQACIKYKHTYIHTHYAYVGVLSDI